MRAFATDVRSGSYDVRWKFSLNVKVPLLNIWPYRLVGNGIDAEREQRHECTGADILVASDIGLRSVERKRSGAFE